MGSKYNTGLFTVVADDSEKIPLEEFAQANWSMNDVGNNCFNSNQTGQQPMFSPGGCLGKVPKVPGIDRKRDEMLQFVETQQLCAAVEVQKKLEIEQIKTAEEGVRQMQKADIAVLREAKHNKFCLATMGRSSAEWSFLVHLRKIRQPFG